MRKTLLFRFLHAKRWVPGRGSCILFVSILCVLGTIPIDTQARESKNLKKGNNEKPETVFHKREAKFPFLSNNNLEKTYTKNLAVDHKIDGTVTDESGKPISGVSVQVKGTTQGVITSATGKFSLTVSEDAILSVSFVGYETQEVPVGNKTKVVIKLKLTASGLNEVVVVGYGTQAKKDLTGTISTVNGNDLKNLPVSNVATALQGKASGVDIVRYDGSPGSVPSIRIRGTGTINDADPLIVIDGVPAGSLNDVDPNDIASVTILKDASASAIYGSRAANGVVLITTKKGGFNQPMKTTVNLYTGQNKVMKDLNMLTAPELSTLKTEAYNNDSLAVPSVWSDPYYAVQRTNWQKALFGTGTVQNADVAVRGGSAKSSYSFSGNYYDEDGIIINSYFKRYSFRINSDHNIGKRLRVGENITYSNTDGNSPGTQSAQDGLVWSAIRFNPALPVKNSDGTWGTTSADAADLGDINNPVATQTENPSYNKNDRILANGYAELQIVKGLSLRANYGFDQSIGESWNFSIGEPTQTRGPALSSMSQGFSRTKDFLEEYYLTYSKDFNHVHKIDFVAGYSSQVFTGNNFGAGRNGFSDTSGNQRVLNLGATSSESNYGANDPSTGIQSYFARGNYSYKGKYLLTATMRADGSSVFAPGKQWGYFPAFSGGWRISDEKFFSSSLKTINSLKITGGWGQLGNSNIGAFQYLSTIGVGGNESANFGTGTANANGAYITSLANPNITWERAVMTNISLEFAILNNHLSGTLTYYNKNTSDMLVPANLVATYGAQVNLPDDGGNITLPDVNIGTLNNHGVEIDLNYHNTIGKVSYSFSGNGSFLRNKVTKLYGDSTYLGSTPYGRENTDISRTYEGQPLASFFGYKTDGLYQTQAQIDNDPGLSNDPNKANIKPGDVKFVDVNGDGNIDDADRIRLGDPNPHFVYGFQGFVGYDHFDFNFNFVGVAGVELYDADRLAGLDASGDFNWYADQMKAWHGEGTSNSIPRLTRNNLNDNYQSSDLWVENGAYLSLKSVSLGYTLAKKSVGTIRFYVSSYNLFYITKYPGYTPELGYTDGNLQRGVDVAQYPATRNVTVGATLNF